MNKYLLLTIYKYFVVFISEHVIDVIVYRIKMAVDIFCYFIYQLDIVVINIRQVIESIFNFLSCIHYMCYF